ncbi:MAG: peptidylprolyl isomerase [Rhodanobacter sp. 68-29]|nr:peptidylprolyl isomerase [Rhodanobacter sp.]ODU74685.1 MAG: peptidylprolyl isomerase [Rhodanobacter sp. SCN 69-32]OJY58098.1 MAG: peptidylprolyl isomerase [Rhodanobacter sp. 68-29]
MSVRVNGVAVDTGDWPSDELAAVHELLRQRARELELLDEGADEAASGEAIEQLLAREVRVPEPTPEECRRWYDAHPERYRSGELVHARHILFQVTPGTPVPAIRGVAEAILQEVRAQPELFAARAREKSNCPSGAQEGQLGQLQRGATVPEFEKAIFAGNELGVLPRLVATRYGFHIVAVDLRIPGELLPYDAVAERVANELRTAAERRALGQYVRVLAGDAELDGVTLEAATSPLVQ